MSQIKISALPEATELNNNEYAVVVQNGTTKKVKVNLLKSGEAGELTGDDGTKYKIAVKNGQLYLYSTDVDTSTPPSVGDNNLFDGLIINKMYGGGYGDNNGKTPVSHSFVELYNLKDTSVNLNGLYLWYKPLDGTWEKLKLRGIIPPHHSFLIRGNKHTDFNSDNVRCQVRDYDMEWDTKFSDQGFSMYLCIGSEMPEVNPVRYNIDNSGATTWTNGRYIDLLGCGGSNGSAVSAFETRFLKVMNSYTGVMREDFANSGSINIGCNKSVKGNNEADCIPINFKECDVEIYGPRSLKDGEWNEFYNKPMLKKSYPNFITICYGEKGDSTRTFTWQSSKTNEGFLKYRKVGESSLWTKVETNKRLIRHKTEDATIHSVIIKDLTAGTYEYQCGEEGCWSDIETFEVKVYGESSPIKMLAPKTSIDDNLPSWLF